MNRHATVRRKNAFFQHRRRRRGAHALPRNSRKKFWQFLCKIRAFSGKNHIKLGNFVNFLYIFFGQKCRALLKLTVLLRLCFSEFKNPDPVHLARNNQLESKWRPKYGCERPVYAAGGPWFNLMFSTTMR